VGVDRKRGGRTRLMLELESDRVQLRLARVEAFLGLAGIDQLPRKQLCRRRVSGLCALADLLLEFGLAKVDLADVALKVALLLA